jgi:OOP family OmpA-OmpF porin
MRQHAVRQTAVPRSQPLAQPALRLTLALLLGATLATVAATSARAAPGDQPVVRPPPAQLVEQKDKSRTVSLPAKGLFKGDQLTDAAKAQLTDLIVNALGLQVEVALLIPVGPWNIDGTGHAGERDLTPARLQALRKYLSDRGVDPKRIFVESRTDAKVKEPRLDVQLVGQPAND